MPTDRRSTFALAVSLSLFAPLVATAACDRATAAPAPAPARVTDPVVLFRTRCAPCHAEDGSGRGPAATTLRPRPRDFRGGTIKFASVASGSLPRDEDYARVIRRGLAGTAMPGSPDLDDAQISGLVARIKTFSPRWATEQPGEPVTVSADPFAGREAEAISEGRTVYHAVARCYACHASYVAMTELRDLELAAHVEPGEEYRERFWEPLPQQDEWGNTVQPPEFTRGTLRGGSELADLARTLACGVGGTPMPAWKDVLEDRQIWAVAHFVRSLTEMDERSSDALRRRLAEAGAARVTD